MSLTEDCLVEIPASKIQLGGLWRRTVDRYVTPVKVFFEKMLSVTLTFEPMTLKISPMSLDLLMSNYGKFHQYARAFPDTFRHRVCESAYLIIYVVSLWPWPLTSQSNQFNIVSNCTEVVNLMKFPQTVYKIRYRVIKHTIMNACTGSPNTEFLQHRFNGIAGVNKKIPLTVKG